MAAETRLNVLKSFQSNGLLLDKEALSILSEHVLSAGGTQKDIMQLIEVCQAGKSAASTYSSSWNGLKASLSLKYYRASRRSSKAYVAPLTALSLKVLSQH